MEAQRIAVALDLESGKLEAVNFDVRKPAADAAKTQTESSVPTDATTTAEVAPAHESGQTGSADTLETVTTMSGSGSVKLAAQDKLDIAPELNWQTFTVDSGDTLSTLFRDAGFNDALMYKVIADEGKKLAELYKGDELRFGTDDENTLQEVILVRSPTESLAARLTEDGYVTKKQIREPDVELTYASGEIDNSLFLAAQEAGLNPGVTMELAGIFAWDIDFVYDIREGDQFDVVYETQYLDGEKIGDGRILAASFVNRGQKITAVLYTDKAGKSAYYTPDGKSIEKAFLRAPIDARISSPFNLQRRHPVLDVVRPHEGTDYAAMVGSPIQASGDGSVRFVGWKGGYGRTVVLQHGNGITTLYAHMSGFARGMKKGKEVEQGDIIGFVGASGMVTGAHLHYEFRVNGTPRNSRTIELPDAEPVPKQEMARFKTYANRLVAKLEKQSGETHLALAKDTNSEDN